MVNGLEVAESNKRMVNLEAPVLPVSRWRSVDVDRAAPVSLLEYSGVNVKEVSSDV